jgi:kynureninase
VVTARNLERVRALDAGDRLGEMRRRFSLPGGVVYLDGNSLGALGANVAERVQQLVTEEWGKTLSAGWERGGWMDLPLLVGERIAPLIGAAPGQVLVADTTSVALAKLLGAALAARPGRRVVLSTTDNFPSDLYAAAGAARLAGATVRVVDRSELLEALDEQVAVCCLTHVDFRTGEMHDLPGITARAQECGALALWDLCHSAGVVPVGCDEHGVDLAVGCTYKYLNGGPGSPAISYVRRELQDELENPLPGWLGHEAPFEFTLEWKPVAGMRRFVTSTPPILALTALDAALDAFEGVTIEQVRAKSVALSELFIELVDASGCPSLEVASPRDAERRGSQVSLRHRRAREVVEAASAKGVVGDFRFPDLCRFGFTPLYLSFEDVYRAVGTIVDVAGSLG